MARRSIAAREFRPFKTKAEFDRWADDWNAAIKEGGGIFGAESLPALRTCEAILADAEPDYAENSPEAFARVILKLIRVTKARIDKGSADQAAVHAWRAGVEWARATMDWKWGAHALRGEKVVTAASDGGRTTNAPRRRKGEKQMARIAELVASGMPVSKAAAQCAHELGGSTEYLRQKWYARLSKRKV